MFDASDQFHQFIASSAPTSSSFPLSFPPLHDNASNSSSFPNSFEPNNHFNSHLHHHHHHQQQLSSFHAHAQAQACPNKYHEEPRGSTTTATSLMPIDLDLEIIERDRSEPAGDHPWSADEVLALLRIRSTFDNWFPQFTWEHVSRKLAELGFKRSPEKCKERFEEESRDLNHMSSTINYRSFQSELEQLYHGEGESEGPAGKKPRDDEEEDDDKIGQNLRSETDPHGDGDGDGHDDPHEHEHDGTDHDDQKVMEESKRKMKRKREERLEILKGLCEDLVRKMVAQQEEMHQKLLEDMVKRDEEMVHREEAWKQQEMDRIDRELEIRAQEQSIAGLRQASIVDFLNKYTPSPSHHQIHQSQLNPSKPKQSSSSTTSLISPHVFQNSDARTQTSTADANQNTTISKDESGKRWPRDEVVALINLRASLYSNIANAEECERESGREGKGPLWERISQGMRELGYKRSAKRCKEKWENINKYFRKTKNANKKRSLDSRTCPYFHQLSALYNHGTLVGTSSPPQNHSSLPGAADSSPKEHTSVINKVAQPEEKDMVQAVSDMGYT